jgi:hypothetical protein
MAGVRSYLVWILRGHRNVSEALDGLSRDLRELQAKVGELDRVLGAIPGSIDRRTADVMTQVAASDAQQAERVHVARRKWELATDDLAERIAAIHARLP